LTARGLGTKEFKEIAEIIHETLKSPFDLNLKKTNKVRVKKLIKNAPGCKL
jgi:glycine/serine hydroxymethyltransferase